MQVDIALKNAKVYDISKADIVTGEAFDLLTDYTGESKWFADNDKVLDLEVTGNNAKVKATAEGTSTILIMNASFEVIKKILISVVPAVVSKATTLGTTADGEPVDK